MKLKSCVVLAAMLAVLWGCSGGEGGDFSTPAGVLAAFDAAVQNNDEAAAQKACTPGFWQSRSDSGGRLFKSAVKRKFALKKKDETISGDRAVLSAEVFKQGKRVDLLYFYCRKDDTGWLFDGVNENRRHGKLYLEKRLPARFNLAECPQNAALKALGEKMIALAPRLQAAKAADQPLETLLEGVLKVKHSPASELRLLLEAGNVKLMVTAHHWVESIQRGAIEMADESGDTKVYLYVAKKEGEWRLVACRTGWLSAESILSD